MKSFIAIIVVAMALFVESPLAQAEECEQRLDEVDEAMHQVQELQKQVARLTLPRLTGILKTGVSQHEAERICRDRGMRLPTARELALIAQYDHGAEGISETEKDGYDLVRGSDSAGNPDHFYFSDKGHKRPVGDLGNTLFWSSSVHPDYPDYAFLLDGYDGGFYYNSSSYNSYFIAVRCVRSR